MLLKVKFDQFTTIQEENGKNPLKMAAIDKIVQFS